MALDPTKRMFRKSGPPNTVRPFQPTIDMNNQLPFEEKVLDALESIAVSLAAIDHNLEGILKRLNQK
ncbi:hypothetical protein C7441_12154 [Pseudaminobacter salicylatoxidans]|uniref:Uncharacterized protein n=1 Tax=Pseudaminobacter salicylatoxidans TaxID=93369 RepID=A0A316BQQ4_PSESE|nr:hypothetical protein [Pseudaminobacter salicylatoxidans]PWJ75272.1 hypothetical protein C7441_12154 [Pseudaminobacter salicylatoxidans]